MDEAAKRHGRAVPVTLVKNDEHGRPKEVYAHVTTHLEPVLSRLGYRAGSKRGFPWWFASEDEGRIFISAQVDTKATDPFAGGGFRFEAERGAGSKPNAKLAGRALFFQLLTDEELGPILSYQNKVIGSLPSPPEAQVNAYPEFLRAQYLSYFQPQTSFDVVQSWLRYRDITDVERWMAILTGLMPVIDRRARDLLKVDQLYLGKGNLVEGMT